MGDKNAYSSYKKVAWRFARVFVVAFLGAAITIQPDELGMWLFLAAMAGFSAGLEALGKALREFVAQGDYKSWIHKLPF